MKIRLLAILLISLLTFGHAYAQSAQVDSTATISILVASPGTEVYELEGHAALRIKDGQKDLAFNWGVFDFNSPNFVYRFVKGETDYMVEAYPTIYFFEQYRNEGRGVQEIILDLTPDEKAKLIEEVFNAIRPENKVYRYNYVKDNCSTRILSSIEKATNDSIQIPKQSDTKESFRDIMRYYHRYYPWYLFGIDLALGEGIDYVLSPKEMAFAPVKLPELLKDATLNGHKLVKQSIVDVLRPQPSSDPKPTPWPLTPLAVSLYILAISIVFTVVDLRRKATTRWFDALLFGVMGILGCIITFLIFISTHEATSPNWLIFWLNPFALIVPALIWLKNGIRAVYCYHFLNFVAILLLLLAWPFLRQEGNIAFLPLIIADVMRSITYMKINRCALKIVDISLE